MCKIPHQICWHQNGTGQGERKTAWLLCRLVNLRCGGLVEQPVGCARSVFGSAPVRQIGGVRVHQ